MRGTGLALLALALPAAAAPPSFMAGVAAYEAGDHERCGDLLLAAESADTPVPANGELLAVECLAAAGRHDEAFAYLRRQLPGGRIAFDELVGKSRPGLDALRRQADWPTLRAEAAALEGERAAKGDPVLRDELLRRAAEDQVARRAVYGDAGRNADDTAWARVAQVDRENSAWLKQVIDARGWPDSDIVGHDGARAAWLLVQHADHDPAFQRSALERMAPAVEAGRGDRSDFALLTDRVLLAEGRPQRFGTQFQTDDDGITRLRPVEDKAGLDARRAAVGLLPMADYRQMLQEEYGTPVE